MSLQLKLEQAFADHQAGRLESAALLYKEILNLAPAHPDALNLLGVLCSQKKRFFQRDFSAATGCGSQV